MKPCSKIGHLSASSWMLRTTPAVLSVSSAPHVPLALQTASSASDV
eukprot:CAMPEP_0180813078 /NCGR_PEP_ID=MMETSP1038_2-20121128/66350_1 /TAXON_ID=632150 /ORGANISM="Azadinium spinosum, Strain 3D9" /LENGTH=45 /DNA_ID= /DNA_START= /DNA_END= /DNA_ORIENTATION=